MNRSMVSALTLIFAALAIVSPAVAQTYTWTGNANTGLMSTPGNWLGGVTPVSNTPNLKIILQSNNTNANQDIATPLILQDLQSNSYFQLYGGALQMDNLGANPTISSAAYTEVHNNINFADPTTFTQTNSQLYLYGTLSGGNLTFNASNGFVGINGAGNTLGGVNTINAGANVQVYSAGGIGGTVNVVGSAFTVQNSGSFSAGTDLNVSAGGQVILNSVTSVDDLDISGGIVYVGGGLNVTGGISSSSGNNTLGQGGGSIALGASTPINVTSSGSDQLNINGPISTGTFTKTGGGRLTLGTFSTNVFSGTNTVSAGILRGSSDAIGTVLNNATVELNGGTLNSSQISGPGNVVVSGFTIYNAAQAYTGATTVEGGNLSGYVTTLPALVTCTGGGGSVVFLDATNVTHTGTLAGALFVSKGAAGVLTLGGNNPYTGGTSVGAGGLAIATDTAIGTGGLSVFGATTLEAIGSRTLANPLFIGNGVTFQGTGSFNFTDATAKLAYPGAVITHNSTGSTSIAGKFSVDAAAQVTVNSGSLALGDGAVVNGFTSAGPIVVNGGTLTLNSLNFINLPVVTLAGGTLNVPNGYAIPLGAVLTGTGGVTGRISTANGSTILASGNLTLGDSAHPAGVNFDGELYTNNNIVTLADSNQAVLGSITDLGTNTLNGTLVAPNGAVLNFGRNIIGRGQIQSNNTLADAVIVNGDVNGDSPTNYLEFTGYVKGVGTFNNAAFSGTFSPGLSPTLMTVGNTILLPSNVLDMELGGLNRGGQYDAFDVTPSSTMSLNGTLKLSLINAFNPALGNQFNLFDGTTVGAFSSFNFPALNAGLMWDTSLLYTQGIVQVVAIPEPAALVMALAAALTVVRRRR